MDINENSIRERARWLWKQAGKPEGRDVEFWLDAENSLRAEGSDGNFRASEGEEHNSNPNAYSPTPFGTQS
ncbi:hypothetical protein ASG47_10145 [Devosia sp. Leaf420]|uniref:DUF2934 domain-containing protein n=1 Tax=Devosia sp. Leaf420 TaxID=1736374 RepID=UPI00071281C1|nr:DUF2934 domain-containing protein [Devosia sp. Leaf420]KQT46959.1 hypothetical protein ASG47_10145 [Devosia sp. Leaf420]